MKDPSDIETIPDGPVEGGYRVKALSMSGNHDPLGFGSRTIGQSGCLMTDFGMAANALAPPLTQPWTPSTLNAFLKKNGCFPPGSSALRTMAAAKALGMRLVERVSLEDDPDNNLAPEIRQHLLFDRGVVIAGIDYKPGASSAESPADHFILIARTMASGAFACVDPAGGHPFILEADLERHDRLGWKVTEAIFLAPLNPPPPAAMASQP